MNKREKEETLEVATAMFIGAVLFNPNLSIEDICSAFNAIQLPIITSKKGNNMNKRVQEIVERQVQISKEIAEIGDMLNRFNLGDSVDKLVMLAKEANVLSDEFSKLYDSLSKQELDEIETSWRLQLASIRTNGKRITHIGIAI